MYTIMRQHHECNSDWQLECQQHSRLHRCTEHLSHGISQVWNSRFICSFPKLRCWCKCQSKYCAWNSYLNVQLTSDCAMQFPQYITSEITTKLFKDRIAAQILHLDHQRPNRYNAILLSFMLLVLTKPFKWCYFIKVAEYQLILVFMKW